MEKLNLESPRFTSKADFPVFCLAMHLARSRHLSKMRGGKSGVKVDMMESSDHRVVGRIPVIAEDLSHMLSLVYLLHFLLIIIYTCFDKALSKQVYMIIKRKCNR